MKWNQPPHWIVALILYWTFCAISSAQDLNCREVSAMARMTHAKSSESLIAEMKKAGNSYRAHVVFTSRLFELNPSSRNNATKLLDLIPKNETQQTVWVNFGESFCQAESFEEMNALDRLGSRLPHDLARAVLIVPGRMLDYISYADTSVQDSHSDYAVQMKSVCLANHNDFVNAVNKLSPRDKKWFVTKIFNPVGCQPLILPEAD